MMPDEEPVCSRRLIEERGPKRKRAAAKNLLRDFQKPRTSRHRRNRCEFHAMAYTGSASQQIRLAQYFAQVINVLLRQHAGNNSESLFLNRSCPNQRFFFLRRSCYGK